MSRYRGREPATAHNSAAKRWRFSNGMIQKCGDGNHYRPHRRLRARAPALGSARWSARLEIVRLGCDGTIARERPDLGPRGARQIRGADGRRIGKGRAAVSGLVRDEPVSRGGRGLRVTYWLARGNGNSDWLPDGQATYHGTDDPRTCHARVLRARPELL